MDNGNTNISPFLRGVLEKNADGEVTSPKNIILSVSTAYTQYTIIRAEHIRRVELYAAIDGMVAGNPPFDQAELEANGLGSKANFNNFKFRSYYERSAQMYWNLINATENIVKIILGGNYPKVDEYAKIMSKHLSDIIKIWPEFHVYMGLLGAQLSKFGYSPIVWPDENSFKWETIDVSKFLIPNQSEANLSKLTCVFIETIYTLQQLYQIYKDHKEGDDWNKEALGNYLVYRANTIVGNFGGTGVDSVTNFVELERMIDNNDGNTARFYSDTVRIISQLQREYDGKISHYKFPRERISQITDSSAYGNEDFLYFVDRQYEVFEEALYIFTVSPGEWTIHGNLGIGQKTYASSQAINMLDCSVVDMSILAATPIIRSLATGGRDLAPIRFTPGTPTDIGGAELIQNQMGANINQLVGASQYLTSGMDVNAANAGDDPGLPDRSQGSISAIQSRARSFKEFGFLKNDIAHFYNTFDNVIKNMFLRIIKAKGNSDSYLYKEEWMNRCIADGVPEELFTVSDISKLTKLPVQFRQVQASRVSGDGSTLARIMGLEALQPIAGTFNPKEMAAYKREWVEATLGVDAVPTYASSDASSDEATGGASLAGLENNAFRQGFPAVFSMDNEHGVHALEHVKLMSEVNKALQQQEMSPVDATKIFEQAIPHTQQHMEAMMKAPMFYQQVLGQVLEPFKQIVKIAQLFKRNAESMIQAAVRDQEKLAEQQQKVMSDEQRKDFVATREQDRKDRESDEKLERNKDQSRERGEIMKEKVRTDADTKRLKVQLDADVKSEATALDRTKNELRETPVDNLKSDLLSLSGVTPSNVDFE